MMASRITPPEEPSRAIAYEMAIDSKNHAGVKGTTSRHTLLNKGHAFVARHTLAELIVAVAVNISGART